MAVLFTVIGIFLGVILGVCLVVFLLARFARRVMTYLE